MAETEPHVPEIPPDAKRAQQHAAPTDLTKPPAEPTPSESSTGGEDEQNRVPNGPSVNGSAPDTPPRAQTTYQSPEPIEAMFAQLREDQKKMERAVMTTNVICLAAIALTLYILRKGGSLDVPTP